MGDRIDVLIRGGTVVDGTGAPGFAASVAISADRLRLVAADAAEPQATSVIDAAGKVVAPGFIDVHSHAGLMILADPRHEPKVRQGVTTEIVGVDGLSYAPIGDRDRLAGVGEVDARVVGPPAVGFEGDSRPG